MRNTITNGAMPGGYSMATPLPVNKAQAHKKTAKRSFPFHKTWLKRACWLLLLAGVVYLILMWWKPARTFRDPLSIPFGLSGNFGELRSNHFHMGLDVRTNGKENLPVYAVADGYVSRIIIEQYGLGKAIFITHNNNYTTVYAHLNTFYDDLEDAVEKRQYADSKRELDITFPAGTFPVDKGAFIAYSGNTGGSEAPHLHFELRNTKTDNNLNPLLYGYEIEDEVAPVLKGLYWYNRQYSTYRAGANAISLEGSNGDYHAAKKVVKVRSPRISLGIRGEDRCSDKRFVFGIYSVELWFDGELIHEATLDNFSYKDSRYINACVDYSRYIRMGSYVQHLSVLPGNKLAAVKGDGIMDLSDGRAHAFKLIMRDVFNNASTLESSIQYSGHTEPPASLVPGVQTLVPGKEQVVNSGSATLYFSNKAFYDTVQFLLMEQVNAGPNKASALVGLHNASVPVHDEYTIKLKANPAISAKWKNRVIMQLNDGKQKYAVKGKWEGVYMSARFNALGTVQLLLDTTPPVIQTAGWRNGQAFSQSSIKLPVHCKDETDAIARFRAEIDGRWALYDQKGDDFAVIIPSTCKPGRHQVKIEIADVAGNVATQEYAFVKE